MPYSGRLRRQCSLASGLAGGRDGGFLLVLVRHDGDRRESRKEGKRSWVGLDRDSALRRQQDSHRSSSDPINALEYFRFSTGITTSLKRRRLRALPGTRR